MKNSDRDTIAALALGAAPDAEGPALVGQLVADKVLRTQYRGDLDAAGVIARSAEANGEDFSQERMERLKARLLSAAAGTKPVRGSTGSYAAILPREKLIDFGPGLQWAVLPDQGRTTVYWIFEPPACGDLPLETHSHKQTGFVLEGDFTLLYAGGGTQPLHAGDHYAIEPGVLHGATFQSRTILCDVYEPSKDDFEKLYAQALTEAKRAQS